MEKLHKQVDGLSIPIELSHAGTMCPGCLHKVDVQGTLLLVKNRGKQRWCMAHNAHVELAGETSEVVTNAGEYSFR